MNAAATDSATQDLDQLPIFPSNFTGTALVVHHVSGGENSGSVEAATDAGNSSPVLIQAAILASLALLGSAINALAIIVFLRRPALRSPSNRFIMSLVGGNLLTAAILFPSIVLRIAARREFLTRNTWIRQSVTALSTLAISGSVHSIVCIALDRHSAVLSPLHYSSPGTKQRGRLLLGSAWGLAALQAALPPILGVEPPSLVFPSPGFTLFRIIYSLLLTTLGLALPLLILCIIYTRMYQAARKNSERTRRHSISAPPLENIIDTNNHHPNKTIHRQNSVFSREEGRAVKTATMVIVSFIFCWTPYFIVLIISPNLDYIRFIALGAALINGIITPFVYVYRSEAVRNEAVLVLCWWKPRQSEKCSVSPAKNLTPAPPRARPPPLGYFDTSTEQESLSVHSFNAECNHCGTLSMADFVATYEVIKPNCVATLSTMDTKLEQDAVDNGTPEMKTHLQVPPGTPNRQTRRESVTFRLAFLPRSRRCTTCIRQNSDSSCGSGQALLLRDSSKDESLQGTPQRRRRPVSDSDVTEITNENGKIMIPIKSNATLKVTHETSLTSSGIGKSLESLELNESLSVLNHKENEISENLSNHETIIIERQPPVIYESSRRPRLQRLPAVEDEEGFV